MGFLVFVKLNGRILGEVDALQATGVIHLRQKLFDLLAMGRILFEMRLLLTVLVMNHVARQQPKSRTSFQILQRIVLLSNRILLGQIALRIYSILVLGVDYKWLLTRILNILVWARCSNIQLPIGVVILQSFDLFLDPILLGLKLFDEIHIFCLELVDDVFVFVIGVMVYLLKARSRRRNHNAGILIFTRPSHIHTPYM